MRAAHLDLGVRKDLRVGYWRCECSYRPGAYPACIGGVGGGGVEWGLLLRELGGRPVGIPPCAGTALDAARIFNYIRPNSPISTL